MTSSERPTGDQPELDVAAIRKDFPILHQQQEGKRLVFLDSAASSQRPVHVVEAMSEFYYTSYANVHRVASAGRADEGGPCWKGVGNKDACRG